MGDKLMSSSECNKANEEIMRDRRSNDEDDGDQKQNGIENMTLEIGPFETKTTDEIISMLKYILKHDKSSETTKGFGLTALMKIRHKYQLQDIDKDDKIDAILNSFNNDKQIEVQQRSIEILSLFESTDNAARAKILKPMPVPKIERLFDESKSNLISPSLSDDDEDDSDESAESTEDDTDKSDDDKSDVSDSDKSDASDQSDSVESDTSSEKRRKRRSSRKKEKEEKRDKKRKDKKKEKAPVIPMLLGPDETESLPNTNGIKIDNVQSPMPARNGNDNISMNMNGNTKQSSNQMDDLLNFGSTSPPKQQQPKSNNSIDDLLGMGGGNSSSQQRSSNNSMD